MSRPHHNYSTEFRQQTGTSLVVHLKFGSWLNLILSSENSPAPQRRGSAIFKELEGQMRNLRPCFSKRFQTGPLPKFSFLLAFWSLFRVSEFSGLVENFFQEKNRRAMGVIGKMLSTERTKLITSL